MPKLHLTHNLMIVGTALLLSAMSALADDAVAPPPRADQTLGTMRSSELKNYQAAYLQRNDQPVQYSGASNASSDGVLQPIEAGSIIYVTGGIGDEERSALKEAAKDYNLHVTSAFRAGEFAGDTHIVIRDRKGTELLDTVGGPLFLARLPAGSYIVEASSEGQTKTQHVTVGSHKTSSVHFSWQ